MKKVFFILATIVLLVPFASKADVISDLQSQLASVLSRIAELKAELKLVESGNLAGGNSCINISRNLHQGMSGANVKSLQEFLAKDRNIYPEGITSGYYGHLTTLAVQRWQKQHGVIDHGTPSTTGFGAVGPKTKTAMRESCSTNSTATPHPVITGGSNVIDFAFTKHIGKAPYTAQVKLSAIENNCMAYKIDWGDGTTPSTTNAPSSTNCMLGVTSQTVTHTYLKEGTYNATLYAGKGPVEYLPRVKTSTITINRGDPYVKVVSPNGGERLKLGTLTPIKWQVANQPADSAVVFYIVGPTGTYRFAKRSHRTQEFNWIVGDRVCDGNGCNVNLPPANNYLVRAVLYSPANACIDFCGPDDVTPTFLANDESDSAFAITQLGLGGNSPLTVSNKTGEAPLSTVIKVNIAPMPQSSGNYEIDFGDGSEKYHIHVPLGETRATTRSVEHVYAQPGTYSVTLRPTGATENISVATITVSNPTFSVTPKSGMSVPATIMATYKTDSSCSINNPITRAYTVDWGDNSVNSRYEVTTNKCPGNSTPTPNLTERHFYHEYKIPGTYTVTYSTNIDGNINRETDTVTVNSPEFSISPRFGFKPLKATARFNINQSCASTGTITTYTLKWGDGSQDTFDVTQNSCSGAPQLHQGVKEFTHTYSELGRYNASLTVYNQLVGTYNAGGLEVVVDKSVLNNGVRQFASVIEGINVSDALAAAIQSIFK